MQTDYDYGGFTMWDTFFREMLGDLTDLDNLKSQVESSGLLYVFFLAATLVLYIAMLNLLIAIISETFARVKKENDRSIKKIQENVINELKKFKENP